MILDQQTLPTCVSSDTLSARTSHAGSGPLVTVIIGSYNPGAFLRESVVSILRQTYSNLEIILIDDGSTDESLDQIADIKDGRMRVLRQANRGRPATLNRGIAEATGEYYVIQDADDVSDPSRIERLVSFMQKHPTLAAVFSGHRVIHNGVPTAPVFRHLSPVECRNLIERFSIPAHDPTGMFRMSLLRDFEYDPSLPFTEAVDYILRVGEKYPMAVIGECLYSYRIHSQSITHRDPRTRHRYVVECCRRACARRALRYSDCFADEPELRRLRNRDRDNNIAAHFIESACDLKVANRRWEAVLVGLRCARMHPCDMHYYKALVYSATPKWFLTSSRRNARSSI